MKNKNLLIKFIVISTLGVLLHFTYDWSGKNAFVGLFSATNESAFEHLKLIFFPMLFLTIYELVADKNLPSLFLPARTIGILSGMFFTLVVFYTTWGILGLLIDYVNILIYFCAVIFALYIENTVKLKGCSITPLTAAFILFTFTICFFVFTNHAPQLGLFYDLSAHPKSCYAS